MRTARTLGALAIGAIAVLLTGCGGGGGDEAATGEPTGAPSTEATATTVPATPTPAVPSVEEVALTASLAAAKDLGQGKAPDSAALATTFPTGTALTMAVRLSATGEPGLRSAWIEARVTRNGVLARQVVFLARRGGWSAGDFAATRERGWDFWTLAAPGEYELTVKVLPGGSSKTMKFTLTPGKREEQMAAPDPAAVSNFDAAITTVAWKYAQLGENNGLPRDALREWRVETLQPYSQSTFSAGQAIGLLFNSNLALAGKETVTWKFQGKELGPPELPDLVAGKIWFSEFHFAHTPGEYEVVLTGQGSSRSLKFQVLPFSAVPGKMDQAGTFARQGMATPGPNGFATTLNAWDRVTLMFKAVAAATPSPTPKPDPWLGVERPFLASLRYAGTVVVEDEALGPSNGWWSFEPRAGLNSGSSLPMPTGPYEVVITNLATGETKSLSFTVVDEEGRTPTPATRAPGSPTPSPTQRPPGTLSAIDQLATLEATTKTPTRTATPKP